MEIQKIQLTPRSVFDLFSISRIAYGRVTPEFATTPAEKFRTC